MRGFFGSFSRSLDSKNRVTLPAEWRDFMRARDLPTDGDAEDLRQDTGFWMTSFYGRIVAYLPEKWSAIVESLNRIPFPSRSLSNFKTKLIGLGQCVEPDAQGRLRIPQSLVREAGLSGVAMLVGMQEKIEIWDEARFDAINIEDISAEELSRQNIELSL